VHGGAPLSKYCRCSGAILLFKEMGQDAVHGVVTAGKEESCWTRYRWNWWSGLLAGNVGGSVKREATGMVLSTAHGVVAVVHGWNRRSQWGC